MCRWHPTDKRSAKQENVINRLRWKNQLGLLNAHARVLEPSLGDCKSVSAEGIVFSLSFSVSPALIHPYKPPLLAFLQITFLLCQLTLLHLV